MDWKIFAVIAVICNAVLFTSLDILTQRNKNCFELTLFVYILLGIVALIIYLNIKRENKFKQGDILLLGVTISAFILWSYFIMRSIQIAPNPSYVQAIAFMHIIVILIGYAIWFKKPVNIKTIIGIVVMFLGLYIIIKSCEKEPKAIFVKE